MIEYSALAVVVTASLYFIALGTLSLFAPALAGRFLLGFAASAMAHYVELLARFIVGLAFLVQAPRMLFSAGFNAFAWLLVVTTVGLLLVPWRWHHRFARQAVPRALRHLAWIGVSCLAMGSFILVAVIGGAAA